MENYIEIITFIVSLIIAFASGFGVCKFKINKQSQKAGDNSNQMQANGDISVKK